MKSYCLLLVLLCSVFAIQSVNCGKLRAKAKNFTPTKYFMEITEFNGVEARDVGVGADGTIWYIGNTKNSDGDYSIHRIQPGSSESEQMSGAAQYISVDPNGNAWTVNKANKMFKYVGTTSWSGVDGKAYDISCSPDGNFYHIGTDSSLYWRTRDGKSWSKLAGTGVRIAGGLSQSVWHVNSAGSIYRRYPGGDWEQVGSAAVDIAVGANGLVWIVTKAAAPNQFAVYDEHLQDWVDAPVSDYLYNSGTFVSSSKTTRIAVAPNGDLLGVREDLSMFRLRFNWSY